MLKSNIIKTQTKLTNKTKIYKTQLKSTKKH